MAYHVVMHSRLYGTEAFPCDNLEHATEVLAQLASLAEEERQKDGEQRYFCRAGDMSATAAAPPEGAPHDGLSDTLVVFVGQGAVQWVATDRADVRVIVCNADLPTSESPATCSSPPRLPFADLPWEVRQIIGDYETTMTLFVHPAPDSGRGKGDAETSIGETAGKREVAQ